MTDYEAYRTYCALKRHFQSQTYDYFKYNGKVKASYSTFEKRSDRFFFAKLAKHKDVVGFLVANLANGNKWIGDLVNEQLADKAYMEWLKRKESLSYVFKSDIAKLDNLIDSMKVIEGQHPILLKKYLSKEICPETLIIINQIQRYFGYWTKNMKTDPVWQEERNKLLKLSPFVQYNDKYKGILIEHFRG